jgi:uncharacterized protein YbjQ (UPF0145 family)
MPLITTTDALGEIEIEEYMGIVSGHAVAGVNIIKDVFAKFSDVFGGNSGVYEKAWAKAHDRAQAHLVDNLLVKFPRANAVVGVSFMTGTAGENASMLTVVATGTAVRVKPKGLRKRLT